jgi:anti-anti-sigma regulatory factor
MSSDSVVVEAEGPLIGGTPPFSIPPEIRPHLEGGVASITLDLAGVEVLDLEGVGFLLFLWRECRRRGMAFRIRGATGPVQAKVSQTGVLELLEGRDRAEMAADRAGSGSGS